MGDNKVQVIIQGIDRTNQAFSSAFKSVDGFVDRLMNFSTLLKGAFYAAPVIALTNEIKKLANEGEEIGKLSQQIGITTDKLSGLKYAADLSETSIESLTVGVGLFSKQLIAAADGSKENAQAFEQLGIQIKDSNGNVRDTYDLLLEVSAIFEKMPDGPRKTAMAMDLFGRSGKDLIPLLNEGADGIKQMQEEAERLGITWTESGAKAADTFNDNITKLTANLHGLEKKILKDVIPALNDLFDRFLNKEAVAAADDINRMSKSIEDLKERVAWTKAHPGLKSVLFSTFFGVKDISEAEQLIAAMNEKIVETFEKSREKISGKGKKDDKKTSTPAGPSADDIKNSVKSAETDFKTIEQLHSIAIDNMKAKSQELLDFEKEYRDYRIESQKLILEVQNAGKTEEKSAYAEYYETVSELQNKQREADKLQGEDRIKLLQEVQKGWKDISGAVEENDRTIISAQSAQGLALTNMMEIERSINAEYDKGVTSLVNQKNKWYEIQSTAETTLSNITARIDQINNQQVKLNLDTTDAENKIKAIQQQINNLNYSAAIKNIDAELAKAAKYDRSEFAIELSLGKP